MDKCNVKFVEDDIIKMTIFRMYKDGRITDEEYEACEDRWRKEALKKEAFILLSAKDIYEVSE